MDNERSGIKIVDEPQLQQVATGLADILKPPLVIFLQGDLGAGKTTFARALIQALGHPGRVKSPTYGLLEHYDLDACKVLHLDLYRIGDADELEFLGITDLFDEHTVLLVEWPEQGRSALPPPDLEIQLDHHDEARSIRLIAHSSSGIFLYHSLKALL